MSSFGGCSRGTRCAHWRVEHSDRPERALEFACVPQPLSPRLDMEPYSRRLPSARAAAADAVACGVFALRWDAGQVRSVKNHPLSGMTLSGLAAFLRRYGRHMQPWRFAARLYFLAALAVLNTLLAWVETLLFGLAVWRTPLQQRPVFVLGQPRSGTTHVHNLLARDERFAHATTFDVGFAHCFLWTARWLPALLRGVLSETRPMDQMALDWTLPQVRCNDVRATHRPEDQCLEGRGGEGRVWGALCLQ